MATLNVGYGNQFVGDLQQQQDQQPQSKDKKQHRPHKIEVAEEFPFPSLFEVMYTDTEEFPAIINGLLRPLFVDYYGSKVEIVNNKQLYTTIFFTEKYGFDYSQNERDDCQYAAIERILKQNENNSAEARIQTLNHLSNFGRSKMFKLTDRAKEMLKDIIPTSAITQKGVDWNKVVYESSALLMNGQSQPTPYVQMVVDVNRILQCIYGRNAGGAEWQYMVSVNNPISPVSTPHGTVSNKWQLFITRVSSTYAQNIASQFGFVIGSNNMGIITK